MTIRALREGYEVIGIRRGWGGLIGDGAPHFFLWHGLNVPGETVLGISFGASLIHPRTVSKRIPPQSEWFDFGRGPGYADFQDGSSTYDFNHSDGRYIYKYSLSLETDPLILGREAQETAVPLWVVALPSLREDRPAGEKQPDQPACVQSWLQIEGSNVLLTGCEWLRKDGSLDVVRVRLSEQAGRETTCTLESLRVIEKTEPGNLPIEVVALGPHRLSLKVQAYSIRELLLYLSE